MFGEHSSLKNGPDSQLQRWESTYLEEPNLFGDQPSYAARRAAGLFKREAKNKILELGCGHGRDTLFFARNGFVLCALDYSRIGIGAMTKKAQASVFPDSITAVHHDVREPLPFEDESFDACYSHMLCCMALTTPQLQFLSKEVNRVLKPDGLNIYTVRTTDDPHYGTGIPRGEDMYEVDGYIVHFFSKEKVQLLAKGYRILSIEQFEEGELPRRLFLVTQRKEFQSTG